MEALRARLRKLGVDWHPEFTQQERPARVVRRRIHPTHQALSQVAAL